MVAKGLFWLYKKCLFCRDFCWVMMMIKIKIIFMLHLFIWYDIYGQIKKKKFWFATIHHPLFLFRALFLRFTPSHQQIAGTCGNKLRCSIYANINIYVCVRNSSYTNIRIFNNTQTEAHIHTNNPLFLTNKLTMQIVFSNLHSVRRFAKCMRPRVIECAI